MCPPGAVAYRARGPTPSVTSLCRGFLAQRLVPGQRGDGVAAVAGELARLGGKRLPVPAGGAHGVRQREHAADALDHPRLAAHDGPALGWVVADLEQAAVAGDVLPVDVQHDDVTRGDADDGIPSAAPQGVSARRPDAGPTLRLQPRRCEDPGRINHAE